MKQSSLATNVAVVGMVSLMPVVPLHAQSGRPGQEVQAELQEVVVTAQKRTESVRDVPKSVDVISASDLEAAGVDRLTDLAAAAVAVSFTDQGLWSKAPGIRGIAPVANSIGVQSQTGIIVDDIPQATFSTLASELADVERIEVLPGPQSTLSGRNATGGLINFVTRQPTRELAADVNLLQTNDYQTRATGFISGPLSNSVAGSFSGVYDNWDGPYRNVLQGGSRLGGYKTYSARGKLRWQPSDQLSATLTAYFARTDKVQPPLESGGAYVRGSLNDTFVYDALHRPFSVLYPGLQIGFGNRSIYAIENSVFRTVDKGATLRLDYDAPAATVSYLASYSRGAQPGHHFFVGSPWDHLTLPITDFADNTDVASKYLTQELRVASSGSGRLTYLFGAIYTDTDMFQPYSRLQLFAVDWDRTTFIRSGALYGRSTLKLSDADSVTAGLRYQKDWIGYTWQFHPLSPTDPANFSQGSSNYGFPSWEGSFKHNFSPDINVYTTYSFAQTGEAYDLEDNNRTGDKIVILPDGSRQVTPGQPLVPLKSERVNSIEVGAKTRLLDGRLTANVDAFFAKYENYQLQTTTFPVGGTGAPVIRLSAIGRVETKGVEIATAFAATRELTLTGNLAYTVTKLVHDPADPTLDGNTLPGAARFKATFAPNYRVHLGSARFDAEVGAFYRYQSKVGSDLANGSNLEQAGFGVLNAYLGLISQDDRYSAQIFANNIFDKNYASFLIPAWLSTGTGASAVYDRNSFRYVGLRFTAKR